MLNPVQVPQKDLLVPVCRAETQSELIKLMERERVSDYKDGIWKKFFRRGGILEWFSIPCPKHVDQHLVDVGTKETWLKRAAEQWNDDILIVPEIKATRLALVDPKVQ